ncbi:hypothetical protein DFH06DRAFT_1197507 [Mycena polygramma]|nr:hypothetical protein DFH06DRAFT_1197507 [Mycena polygramma]
MRAVDPSADNGAFRSLTTEGAVNWVLALGHIHEIDPRIEHSDDEQEQRKIATENLRVALWDVQRFDYLFPQNKYSKSPNLRLWPLESWPDWKTPHPEVRDPALWKEKMEGKESGERMNSYVATNFTLLSFTQLDLAKNFSNPPEGSLGNWIGTKKIMSHAGQDITEGGRGIPFLVYSSENAILIMEILDVKRLSWPEPSLTDWNKLKDCQEAQLAPYQGGPLVPILRTPKIPLVVIRYSYTKGRPKEFIAHLESRIFNVLPPLTSNADVRVHLENHIKSARIVPEAHLLMLARLLSFNASLINPTWVSFGISEEVKRETRISFFVPCLRPRFRVIEQIETGLKPTINTSCLQCHKETNANTPFCNVCKAVYYCSYRCALKQLSWHTTVCPLALQITHAPTSLAPNKLYVPLLAYSYWVGDFGFSSEVESIQLGNPSMSQVPENEYGTEHFICRLAWKIQPGLYHPGRREMVLYDRRRSVLVHFGPKEVRRAEKRGMTIPFHEDGYSELLQVLREDRETTQGGHSMYLWVRRAGECIEVDLKDIPEQSMYRWQ